MVFPRWNVRLAGIVCWPWWTQGWVGWSQRRGVGVLLASSSDSAMREEPEQPPLLKETATGGLRIEPAQ